MPCCPTRLKLTTAGTARSGHLGAPHRLSRSSPCRDRENKAVLRITFLDPRDTGIIANRPATVVNQIRLFGPRNNYWPSLRHFCPPCFTTTHERPLCRMPGRNAGRCALQPCTTETGVTALAREDEARRRAMREQSALGVGDAAFGRADTTAAVEHISLGPDLACLQRDGSDKRNLELEGRAADPFFEHRLDRQAHAAIEKCRREAAMHRARWIEMSARWIQRDDDATAFGLHHIIPQGLCDCVEGQHSAGKALDELQPAHRLLSLGTDRS